MNCQECVLKLNRTYQLKLEAIQYGKAHSIYRTAKLHAAHFVQARSQFKLVELDSINTYELLIGPNSRLREINYMKQHAYKQKEYEIAALFRDQEIYLLRKLFTSIGFDPSQRFYCKDEVIYCKS